MGLLDFAKNVRFEPSAGSLGLLAAGIKMMQASTNQRQPISVGSVLGAGFEGGMQGMQYKLDQQSEQQHQNALFDQQKKMVDLKRQYDFDDQKRKADGLRQVLSGIQIDPEKIKQNPLLGIVTDPNSANIDPEIYSDLASQAYKSFVTKPDKIHTTFNPVFGNILQYDDAGNIYQPDIAQGSNNVQTQVPQNNISRSTSVPALPGWNTKSTNTGVDFPNPISPKQALEVQMAQVRLAQDAAKRQQEAEEARIEEARKFIEADKTRAINNQELFDRIDRMQQYLELDNKSKNELPWSLVPDNEVFNEWRGRITTDPGYKGLKREIDTFAYDKIREMGEAGGSSKVFDSDAERKALNSTIMDPTAPYADKVEAIKQLRRKAEQADKLYQNKLNEMYKRLGMEAPKSEQKAEAKKNVISVNTGNKPVGSTGMMNGKKIRVIAPGQVEVLE